MKHGNGRRPHGRHTASRPVCVAVQVNQQPHSSTIDALGDDSVGQAQYVFKEVAVALEAAAHLATVAGTERHAHHVHNRCIMAAEEAESEAVRLNQETKIKTKTVSPSEKTEVVGTCSVSGKIAGYVRDMQETEGRPRNIRDEWAQGSKLQVLRNSMQAIQTLPPRYVAKDHAVIAAEHWRLPSAVPTATRRLCVRCCARCKYRPQASHIHR
jgi:hypothetical protein